MRWIRYTAAGKTAYRIVEGDRIVEVAGDPFTGYEPTAQRHALAAVKVEVPVVPRTFYCAGLNYTAHVIEQAKKRGVAPDIPSKPDIGYRAVNALIADGEAVVIPRDATKVQYEGELVAVIGKRAKHLGEAEALSCVLGYTIGNDVSERSWQRSDRTLWRAKNTDTFKPMGPWIESEETVLAVELFAYLQRQAGLSDASVQHHSASRHRKRRASGGDVGTSQGLDSRALHHPGHGP